MFSWLRKLVVQDGQASMQVGGSLGGGEPRPFKLPAKSPAQHQTAADVLDWLCKKYQGTYDRRRTVDGKVVIRFYGADDSVVSGIGKDTMSAVAALQGNLEKLA